MLQCQSIDLKRLNIVLRCLDNNISKARTGGDDTDKMLTSGLGAFTLTGAVNKWSSDY